MQALRLAQDRTRMLQQRAAGLGRSYPLAPARQQRNAEHVFHVTDARGGCGEREMRALGAMGDGAGFDDVAKQTEVGEVESHGLIPAFALYEVRI